MALHFQNTFTVTVTNVNEAPYSLTLSIPSGTIPENFSPLFPNAASSVG